MVFSAKRRGSRTRNRALRAVALCIASLNLGSSSAAPSVGQKTRVLLVPFQPVYRSVSGAKAERITTLVKRELERTGRFEVLGSKEEAATPVSAQAGDLSPLVKTAEAHLERKDVLASANALERALAIFEENPTRGSFQTYFDLHARLAQVLFFGGRDEDATIILERAARLSPAAELERSVYSRFYRMSLDGIRERILEERPASVVVRSPLAGTTIYFDGRAASVAPVRIEGALSGVHLFEAKTAGKLRTARLVELRTGSNPDIDLGFETSPDRASVVMGAIAENQLSPHAVSAAAKAAQAVKADYVVCGGLSRSSPSPSIEAHTVLVRVKEGTLTALGAARFDLDLLTAPSDVLFIVERIEAGVRSEAGSSTSILRLDEALPAPRTQVHTFDARVAGPRKTTERSGRKRRVIVKPLGPSGSIRIKDERD